ncbi:uncharacterized protein [Nicotiana tomentosiformis]|uniref:uncharacterized protein n=1 Tax=Nicotiana tomentosiformis TaxID=4098 RepID=UPI00388CBC80
MEDITEPLSVKRWWRFKTQPSLLATFLNAKYCKRAHLVTKVPTPSDSHIWRYLTKARTKAEPNIIWKIQAGNSSFWWDNWTDKVALAKVVQGPAKSPKLLVKNFIHEGTWDTNKFAATIPPHLLDTVTKVDIGNKNLKDFPIWNLAEDVLLM